MGGLGGIRGDMEEIRGMKKRTRGHGGLGGIRGDMRGLGGNKGDETMLKSQVLLRFGKDLS